MLLMLLGCGWLDQPYACEYPALDWWEGDPAWLVRQAARDEHGVWQFDAPSGYAAIERTEGFWSPDGERFAFTQWATEASSHTRVDLNATGTVDHDGDLELEAEVYSYDELGFLGSWFETIERDGCETERVRWTEDDEVPEEYSYEIVDADTIEGTFRWAYDESWTWEESSTLTRDLTRTARGGWADGSYEEESVSTADGVTEISWEDHAYADEGWETFGEDRWELDGTRHGTTREEYQGELARECEITETYAGVGSATCYQPEEDRTCDFTWDSASCTYVCDDATEGTC